MDNILLMMTSLEIKVGAANLPVTLGVTRNVEERVLFSNQWIKIIKICIAFKYNDYFAAVPETNII